MIILKNIPEINGTYKSQSRGSQVAPEGFVKIPDEFSSIWDGYKPFVTIAVENDIIVSMVDNSEARVAATPTEEIRAAKIAELSVACNTTILSGFESECLGDVKHYR